VATAPSMSSTAGLSGISVRSVATSAAMVVRLRNPAVSTITGTRVRRNSAIASATRSSGSATIGTGPNGPSGLWRLAMVRCGSASTSAGLWPVSSQWAARLRARVDLPTPPFEVARVMVPNMRALS
jgi:hypothetical protein